MIYLGNMKRAKDSIFDITMCNDWKYFFTGTFDDSKAGENTTENLLLPVQNWLKNQVRRKGLQYVLVAEYSPLNHRIHFHGLLNEALELVDSGTVLCTGKKRLLKLLLLTARIYLRKIEKQCIIFLLGLNASDLLPLFL